jgi:hypothetical protein
MKKETINTQLDAKEVANKLFFGTTILMFWIKEAGIFLRSS